MYHEWIVIRVFFLSSSSLKFFLCFSFEFVELSVFHYNWSLFFHSMDSLFRPRRCHVTTSHCRFRSYIHNWRSEEKRRRRSRLRKEEINMINVISHVLISLSCHSTFGFDFRTQSENEILNGVKWILKYAISFISIFSIFIVDFFSFSSTLQSSHYPSSSLLTYFTSTLPLLFGVRGTMKMDDSLKGRDHHSSSHLYSYSDSLAVGRSISWDLNAFWTASETSSTERPELNYGRDYGKIRGR